MENPKQGTRQELAADDQEIKYWSNEFGIAKEELLTMVKRGVTIAAAVEAYVKKIKIA